jgi:hypothetical protein
MGWRNPQNVPLVGGRRSSVLGRRSLGIGLWSLGRWSFVVGRSSFVVGRRPSVTVQPRYGLFRLVGNEVFFRPYGALTSPRLTHRLRGWAAFLRSFGAGFADLGGLRCAGLVDGVESDSCRKLCGRTAFGVAGFLGTSAVGTDEASAPTFIRVNELTSFRGRGRSIQCERWGH